MWTLTFLALNVMVCKYNLNKLFVFSFALTKQKNSCPSRTNWQKPLNLLWSKSFFLLEY